MTHVLQSFELPRTRARTCAMLASTFVLLAGCASTEPRQSRPVAIQLASGASTSSVPTASPSLHLSTLRLVVTTAALGSGNEFGCQDCQDNAEETPATPKLLTVPLTGGTIFVATEQASPGRYSQAEISVEQPVAATLAGTANWPAGATILIEGTYNGKSFQLPLSIVGTFRETLNPALEVSATGAPATTAITITLPVTSWFQANGVALDPTDATQRATIEANARGSFQPLEAAGRER